MLLKVNIISDARRWGQAAILKGFRENTDPVGVRFVVAFGWVGALALGVGCGNGEAAGPPFELTGGGGQLTLPDPLHDAGGAPDAAAADDGIGRFASVFYFDLEHVERISRFRSGLGHDYADYYEACRSMKHYICPNDCDGPNSPPPGSHDPPWTELELRAPADSSVVRMDVEQTYGTQLVLAPDGLPDVFVKIFHVTPGSGVFVGAHLEAGQVIGTHATDLTMSDIAVERHLPAGFKLYSFFEVLTDEAFAPLLARGVPSREALQISAAERDADPLACDGERFLSEGALENWVELD